MKCFTEINSAIYNDCPFTQDKDSIHISVTQYETCTCWINANYELNTLITVVPNHVPGGPPTLHIFLVSLIKHTWFRSSAQWRLQDLKWLCQTKERCKMCSVGGPPGTRLGTTALILLSECIVHFYNGISNQKKNKYAFVRSRIHDATYNTRSIKPGEGNLFAFPLIFKKCIIQFTLLTSILNACQWRFFLST